MCKDIIARKTETYSFAVGGASEVNKTINIEFLPDEIHLKQLTYCNDFTENNISIIRTNLITQNDSRLGSFFDGSTSFTNATFDNNNPINGQYNFYLLTAAGAADTTRNGGLSMTIEYVKYKE